LNWDSVEVKEWAPANWEGPLLERFFELYRANDSFAIMGEKLSAEFKFRVTTAMIAGRVRRMLQAGKLEARDGNAPIRRDSNPANIKPPAQRRKALASRPKPPKPAGRTPVKSKRIVHGNPVRTLAQNEALRQKSIDRFDAAAEDIGPGIDMMQLTQNTCHWPLAKVEDYPPYRYCGCQTLEGSPWCPRHYRASLDPHRQYRKKHPEFAE
jgi:hypothetical protein